MTTEVLKKRLLHQPREKQGRLFCPRKVKQKKSDLWKSFHLSQTKLPIKQTTSHYAKEPSGHLPEGSPYTSKEIMPQLRMSSPQASLKTTMPGVARPTTQCRNRYEWLSSKTCTWCTHLGTTPCKISSSGELSFWRTKGPNLEWNLSFPNEFRQGEWRNMMGTNKKGEVGLAKE